MSYTITSTAGNKALGDFEGDDLVVSLRSLELVIVDGGNDVLSDRARRNAVRLAGFECDSIVSYRVDNSSQTSALNGNGALRNIQLVRLQDNVAPQILSNESACKPRGYAGYATTRRRWQLEETRGHHCLDG